ncbi:MAG: hypothetical protein GEV28_39790 [Actinophytocola sp.]|nr:hypothetical protein [Actinophytocola sp.]
MGEPIELAVLPDQKVLYINRGTTDGGGQVRLYNPATSSTTVALTLPLDARFEDGLIGITTHPRFATNRYVYLFYSPKSTPLVNRISRFTFDPTTNTIPASTEDMLVEWPTERDLCCHSAVRTGRSTCSSTAAASRRSRCPSPVPAPTTRTATR